MVRPEHVPRPQYRGVQSGIADQSFPLSPHLDVIPHHRCRMSHADVDEMTNPGEHRRANRRLNALEIDIEELLLLPGPRMRDADQVNEGIAPRDLILIRRGIQRVAGYRLATFR